MSIDLESHIKTRRGSDKVFGLVFSFIFLIVSLFTVIYKESLLMFPLFISILFLLISFIKPTLLSPLNNLWTRLGVFLGFIISPLIILMVYIIGVIPTGIYVKITRKNLLMKDYDKNYNSYWIKRKTPVGTMKSQF